MDPLTWAYLAVMLASTGANYAGQRKVGNERAKVMAEDRRRRQAQQMQNDAAARNTQEAFARSRADEEARGKQMGESYKEPLKTATPTGRQGEVRLLDTTAPTSSTATINDFQNEMAKQKNFGDQLAELHGRLGGYGSVLNENMIKSSRNESDINQGLTSMRSWAQNVLPAQLEAANQSGNQWKGTGDVLKLAGTIMAPWALGTSGAGLGKDAAQEEIIGATRGKLAGDAYHWLGGGIPWQEGAKAGLGGATGFAPHTPVLSEMDQMMQNIPSLFWPRWYREQRRSQPPEPMYIR